MPDVAMEEKYFDGGIGDSLWRRQCSGGYVVWGIGRFFFLVSGVLRKVVCEIWIWRGCDKGKRAAIRYCLSGLLVCGLWLSIGYGRVWFAGNTNIHNWSWGGSWREAIITTHAWQVSEKRRQAWRPVGIVFEKRKKRFLCQQFQPRCFRVFLVIFLMGWHCGRLWTKVTNIIKIHLIASYKAKYWLYTSRAVPQLNRTSLPRLRFVS